MTAVVQRPAAVVSPCREPFPLVMSEAAKEADARHHIGRNAGSIGRDTLAPQDDALRHDHAERRTKAHQHMRLETCLLVAHLSVHANHGAAEQRTEQAQGNRPEGKRPQAGKDTHMASPRTHLSTV